MPKKSTKISDQDPQYKFNQRKDRKKRRTRYMRWSQQENQIYVRFLNQNYELFGDQEMRKNSNIFKKMAKELKNRRNNHQCRSHHVKLMNKFGQLNAIIDGLLPCIQWHKKQQNLAESICRKYEDNTRIELKCIEDEQKQLSCPLFQELAGPPFTYS